jgi:hypothetical protein
LFGCIAQAIHFNETHKYGSLKNQVLARGLAHKIYTFVKYNQEK